MPRIRAFWLLLFAMAFPVPSGGDSGPPSSAKKEPPTARQIRAWIDQLGDADFDKREAAEAALLAAGPHAMAAVLAATKSTDREVARRAGELAVAIEDNAAKVLEAFGANVQRRKDGKVYSVDFRESKDSRLTDADLIQLLALPRLEILNLEKTTISDEGLKVVGRQTGLGHLTLEGRRISDAGLSHLAQLKRLSVFEVFRANILGSGLAQLKGLKELESLYFEDCPVTDEGLREGTIHCKELSRLKSLGLLETKVTDAGLAHLLNLESIARLRLDRSPISGKGLAYLNRLPNLTDLVLRGTPITDEACDILAKSTTVQRLFLAETKVTVKGVKALQSMPRLSWLSHGNLGLNPAEIDELRRAFPKATLTTESTKVPKPPDRQ